MSKLLFRSPHSPSAPGRPGPVARLSPRAASLCKAGEADTKFISTLLCHFLTSFADATYLPVFPRPHGGCRGGLASQRSA